MEYYCISNCDDLTYLNLGNNLRNIGGFSLSELPKLKEIKLPGTLTYINEFAFCGLYSLEHIDFPDSLKYISEYSVCGLNSVKHIDMSNMPVCSFVTHAFSGFNELETLVLPQCVSQFPPDSFGFMPKLRELTLSLCSPDNERPWVDEDSFQNLPSLERIYNPNTTPPNQYNQDRWIVFGETIRDNITPLDYENCILYVPEDCVEVYRSNPGWNKFVHIEEYAKASSPIIEEITSKSPVEYIINSTRLTIRSARTADVMICDLSGRVVFKRAISGSETIDLPEDVYLFRHGLDTTKIFIK